MENEEFNKAISNQRYNYYLSKKINNSDHANMILEQIKNGYEPNDADVFELCCDEQDKIDEYREMYDIKQRVKDGQISEEDYNYLINKIGVKDEYLESALKQMLVSTGKIVDEYDERKSTK